MQDGWVIKEASGDSFTKKGGGASMSELCHKKKYEFRVAGGSVAEIEIEAKIKDVSKNDLEDILHEVATCTHNFYLSLDREIADVDQK
ncbi:hypothetical protein D7X48_18070 [bacterium D16-50]|nr:hypothetical protein D7X48_18070 [bacterium D16-50]